MVSDGQVISVNREQETSSKAAPPTLKELWGRVATIEGFFSEHQFLVWDWFFQLQRRRRVKGAIAEIGVWKGRSAAALTCLATPGERVILCDFLIETFDVVNQLAAAGFDVSGVEAHPILSQDARFEPRSVRWFHIDGDHSRERAYGDLVIAEQALGDGGIICLDDFFTPRYVGIVWATFQFLQNTPSLRLLLVGDNKAYLCRAKVFADYREAVLRELPNVLAGAGSHLGVHQSYSLFDCETLGLDRTWKPGEHLIGHDENPNIVENVKGGHVVDDA